MGHACALQELNHLLTLLGGPSTTAQYDVDSCLAEVEDLLSYCNDILCTGNMQTLLFVFPNSARSLEHSMFFELIKHAVRCCMLLTLLLVACPRCHLELMGV